MASITDLYQVGGSEKIKNIEDELQKELSDLKNDIEENEAFGASLRVASSVRLPQSVEFFRKQRELTIKRAMEVSEAQPLVVQAHVMQDELDNCSRLEYTDNSLPLILHQFYCDRIQQLVQCKHLHMLRWKRFCEHTNVLESLFPMYQKRIEHIMSEYNDAVARATRLQVAHESHMMGKSTAKNAITLEDVMIYTRWLTCHFHATKKINSFLKVLEYVPVKHKHDTVPPVPHDIEQSLEKTTEKKENGSSETQSKWFSHHSILVSSTASVLGRPTSGSSMTLPSSPLSASVNIPGTNAIPHAAAGMAAAAAAGGGPASDGTNLGLPFHESDFEKIKPMLEFLCTCYGINMDLNSVHSSSDEMELITHVNRRFKTVFAKQEQQKTYPMYDKLEIGRETWGADMSSHALKKEANWLSFVKLKPIKDPIQEKSMTKLRQKNNIDELLKAQSKFFSISDSTKVQDALKEHAMVVKDPPEFKAVSVTSHRTKKNTNAIWRKIYCNHKLYDGSSKEVDLSVTEFDEKETDNVNFGGRSSRSTALTMSSHRRKDEGSGEFNYQSAMQMLGLDDDDSAGRNPTSMQGGYLSLLNLRHLRIRDLKRTCLSILNYFRSVERTLTINDGGLSLEAGQQKRLSQQNHRVSTYDGGMVGGNVGIGNHGYLHYTPADFKLQESAFMEFSEIENHDDYYSIDEGRVHVQDQRGYYIIYDVALADLKNLEHDLLLIATHYLEKDQDRRLKENGVGLPRTHKLRVKHALFSDVFAEDPLFMCEMGQSMLNAIEATAGRRSQTEKQQDILKVWNRLLETITLRFRLMDAAFETEVLSNLYRVHANELGFDDCHMFLRCVQFEFANFKENADQPPPLFITALQEDDSNLDRYTPSSLFLAVHELDEKHVGTFSFRTRDGYLKVLRGNSMESLQVVLMAQVVHKNALLSAVQQASICSFFREQQSQDQPHNLMDADLHSDNSSLMVPKAADTSIMGVTQSVMYAAKLKTSLGRIRRSPEAFVSIQLEKAPSRDVMLNNYLNKKASMATVLKNQEEVEKLKRTLIGEFCQRFMRRISQYSLRAQIIAYLNTIEDLLEGFPSLRNSHFMVGMPGEKKTKLDDKDGLLADPRTIKRRPRRLLSSDGTTLLNLWFLPHHSEVLMMFKNLDEASCISGLLLTLRIIASLHDILQYLCAHAKLGSSHARLGSQRLEFATADWGGTEGISAELREIQKQINNLEDPTNPSMVADFLALRKAVMFLEFETSIRHSLRDTFLSTSNSLAYNSVTDNIYYALPSISNIQVPTVNSMYLPVPEPLEPRDADAKLLFPWRSFLGSGGPFPLQFWQFHQIESRMQLCLASLKDVDRHVSNGEILGVSLLMEDVLQSGQEDISMLADDSDSDDNNITTPKKAPRSRPRSAISTKSETSRPASARGADIEEEVEKEKAVSKKALSRTTEPMEAYALLRNFLLLWKRLEVFKDEWGKRKLEVESIGKAQVYKKFCKLYKTDILYPTIKSIARRYGQEKNYDGMVSDSEPIVAPRGVSEMEIRAKQLVKLLDNFENHMIYELQRKISREHSLVVAERGREEGNLPVDLWKRPVINERLTIAQPHIAEEFTRLLLDKGQQKGEDFVIPQEHLNLALSKLASMVMTRERSNYDNYSMFYENILRQQHQIIYQREQEIKHANEMASALSESSLVDVQCQLADKSHELILEVTSLRAKISEMREAALVKEQELRQRLQKEYNSLIQNLFAVAFGLKGKLDEFRTHLYDQVFTTVGEVRRDAVMAMSKLKSIKHDNTSTPDNALQHKLTKAEELRKIRHENDQLNKMLSKLRTVNSWRLTKMRAKYKKEIAELHSDANQCKRDYLEIKLMAEEEVILLRQQLVSLKSALSLSEQEREAIQKQIDKELQIKKEKKHKEEQHARNARQLEIAKAANMSKLIHEAEAKEEKLKALTDDFSRSIRLNQMYQDKSKRDASQMRQQLEHERTLKLDAFSRVDELQTQVYDYEQETSLSRPYTSMSFMNPVKLPPMRSKSSDKRSRSKFSPSPNPVNNFPPNYQQRSLTPEPWSNGQNNKDAIRTTQRPQTVGSKLRNRIAEQLLTNLPPNHHETIMQLQAWEQQYQKK
ncbi:uncharacterized protein LOC117107864 [Anneissia japonica]|uniref:uncharacterized protein LOC117107864 n=1 Tax=Anneissia japonica TaxID=1529436 RepID=UPI00142565D7|nr:uncharacterized protein LOC117107864 [Anneissia japonica]